MELVQAIAQARASQWAAQGQRIAAIDCGSNAIRACVADVGAGGVDLLERHRRPVRLGGDVFTTGCIGPELADRLVAAVEVFAQRFEELGARGHIAVATSAMRNASNGAAICERIRERTGVVLQTITGDQEAALVRRAVVDRCQPALVPDVIADLGGGSLEVQILRDGRRVGGAVLPVGTVRLGMLDSLDSQQLADLHQRISAQLETIERPASCHRLTLCGGNAKALAKIFPGLRDGGLRTLDLATMRTELDALCRRSVTERVRHYGVRLDRAEVMATAAVVLDAVGKWLVVGRATVPGVGVLDGLLAAQRAHLSL